MCCIKNAIYPVLNEWKSAIKYVKPFYTVSYSSPLQLINLLHQKDVGFISNSPIYNKLSLSNNIICNNPLRTTTDIIYAKNAGVSQYTVSTIDELLRVHAYLPNACFWVKAHISKEGTAASIKMFNYIWEQKCLYNGICYNINNFSNAKLGVQPSMYSHKIAIEYLFRNELSYTESIGLRTTNIHIEGGREFVNITCLSELHTILTDANLIHRFNQKGITLQASVNNIFDSIISS